MTSVTDLIRRYFHSYEIKDKHTAEQLLAEDFTFSSPFDDNISREEYFRRCWPNSEHHRAIHIQKVAESGDDAFVTYECERTEGTRFRNTEFFQTKDGQIRHVDVYFGNEEGPAEKTAEVRYIMDQTVQAVRAKDAAAMLRHYAPDVLAFDLITPIAYRGVEEVRRRAEQWFGSFVGPLRYDLHDLRITAGDDVAFCHSLNHVIGTTTEGAKIDMAWRATVCFREVDGIWTITHLHSSVPFDMNSGKAALDLKPVM